MAQKSKSQKSKDNSSGAKPPDDVEDVNSSTSDTSESSDTDAPVVIEAEAKEVSEADEAAKVAEAPDDAEDKPAAASEAAIVPTSAPAVQHPSVWPLLIGGLAAGGIGYLSATFLTPTPAPTDTTELSSGIAEAEGRIDTLSDEIAALRDTPAVVDLSAINDQISGLANRLEDLGTDIAIVREDMASVAATLDGRAGDLSNRLTVLETTGGGQGAEATEEELAAFRAELDRMTADAERRIADAETKANAVERAAEATAAAAEQTAAEAERRAAEAAEIAKQRAALVDLKAALESGRGYADILPLLGEVPKVLTDNAETGVATLVSLQQAFPQVARSALSLAETMPENASTGEKLTAFLKRQTNARSLTPQEGSGTDAVLSRAEASLKQGDLGATLNELEALSEGPKAAMQGWLDQAMARASSIEAAAQLTVTN